MPNQEPIAPLALTNRQYTNPEAPLLQTNMGLLTDGHDLQILQAVWRIWTIFAPCRGVLSGSSYRGWLMGRWYLVIFTQQDTRHEPR